MQLRWLALPPFVFDYAVENETQAVFGQLEDCDCRSLKLFLTITKTAQQSKHFDLYLSPI